MTDLPPHSEFNDESDGERIRRLVRILDSNVWVESIDVSPGGAVDSVRIKLRQYSGTVPESVVRTIYDQGLAIRNVGGYYQVLVSPPERIGGDLDDDEEVRAGEGGDRA